MRYGSLASGIGGLDLAVEAIFDAEAAWHAEFDPNSSKILEKHWSDIPNYQDITKIDFEDISPIDILCGGYPCQPFSTAGKRKGFEDERNLWPYFNRAIRILRPRFIVLGNVAAHLSLGFGRVLGDLAETGYDAQWGVFRASDVGAPHRRERIFILASSNSDSELERPKDRFGVEAQGRSQNSVGFTTSSSFFTNADSLSLQTREVTRWLWSSFNRFNFQTTPDACSKGLQGGGNEEGRFDFGPYQGAIERWAAVRGEDPPYPLIRKYLNPEFLEWMMGFPINWTEGVSNRSRIKALGNAVLPHQGMLAIGTLLAREEVANAKN
jgi:DNA (cytosine-5)-methyltransferase 1